MGSLKATEPLKRPERQSGICQGIESLSGIESSDVYESEGHHLNWARKRNTVNLSPFTCIRKRKTANLHFRLAVRKRKTVNLSTIHLAVYLAVRKRKTVNLHIHLAVRKRKTANLSIIQLQFGRGKPQTSYPPGSSEEENRKPQHHPL